MLEWLATNVAIPALLAAYAAKHLLQPWEKPLQAYLEAKRRKALAAYRADAIAELDASTFEYLFRLVVHHERIERILNGDET